jgi:hypothetical protein
MLDWVFGDQGAKKGWVPTITRSVFVPFFISVDGGAWTDVFEQIFDD